jgi:hypothetical protein
VQGNDVAFRFCVKEQPPDSRTFWEEISKDGTNFLKILEGKGTRAN